MGWGFQVYIGPGRAFWYNISVCPSSWWPQLSGENRHLYVWFMSIPLLHFNT